MTDIIPFPHSGPDPVTKDALEAESAAALHFLMAAGDIAELEREMGSLTALPKSLKQLHEKLHEAGLLYPDNGKWRVRTERIPKLSVPEMRKVSSALSETLTCLSSPAVLKKLFETVQDDILIAGGDIIGTLNERRGAIWGKGLVEQTAWRLVMEGRDAAETHLSSIDHVAHQEMSIQDDAAQILRASTIRKAEIEKISNQTISDGFVKKMIETQEARLTESQSRATEAIDAQISALARQPGSGPATPLSSVMADVVAQRTSPLCLSEFDYRRLPLKTRHEHADRQQVHILRPGQGLLANYAGQALGDRSGTELREHLSLLADRPETHVRLAAIGANILRRNRILVGASAREAGVFLEAAKTALRGRQAKAQKPPGRDTSKRQENR